jgi:hypothetical protein
VYRIYPSILYIVILRASSYTNHLSSKTFSKVIASAFYTSLIAEIFPGRSSPP